MKKKSVLLIGLGRFGRHLAVKLNDLGHDVMAIDDDEERIDDVIELVTNAQIGDSTNIHFLKKLASWEAFNNNPKTNALWLISKQ